MKVLLIRGPLCYNRERSTDGDSMLRRASFAGEGAAHG